MQQRECVWSGSWNLSIHARGRKRSDRIRVVSKCVPKARQHLLQILSRRKISIRLPLLLRRLRLLWVLADRCHEDSEYGERLKSVLGWQEQTSTRNQEYDVPFLATADFFDPCRGEKLHLKQTSNNLIQGISLKLTNGIFSKTDSLPIEKMNNDSTS